MSASGGVCFIFDDFHPVFSGHSVYMQQIMKRLQDRGRKVTVICSNPGHLAAREQYRGIEIVRIEGNFYDMAGRALVLRALWSVRHEFDCLHINGFPDPHGMIVGFCRLLGKRLVLQSTLYGSDDGFSYRRHHRGGALRVKQLALVDAITAISQPLIETFLEIGFPPEKLVYIPQGVDLHRFVPGADAGKQDLRDRLGIRGSGPTALFVGTVLRRKGVDWLIDAWREVQRRVPAAHLVLVGMYDFDESHENRDTLNAFSSSLAEQVRDHGLNVQFVGLQEDIVAWYQAADLFVLPSRKEGFGNVIIEAMASRLPVIVTPMDGVAHETVTPGSNGYIVQDVAELADRICLLLEDSVHAADLGVAGEEIARRKFDLDVIAGKYDALYFGD